MVTNMESASKSSALSDSLIVSGGVTFLSKYVAAAYEPKQDITAYELACLMPYLLGNNMREEDWAALGEAQRHLRRTD